MLTEKDYCDYELIVELEQLGMLIKIDFTCGIENGQLVKTKFYPNPPSLYEAQKWLREEKDIMVCPVYDKNTSKWVCSITDADSLELFNTMRFDSYEKALSEGIKEAVKNLSIC